MIWLTVKEVAALLGYSERAIRYRAKSEYKIRYKKSSAGQGGKRMEILLESLPEQAQKAYLIKKNGGSESVINMDYTSTKAQKEKGVLRAQAVAEYRKFEKAKIKEGITSKCEIKKIFVSKWNDEHPEFKASVKSLYDWMHKSKSGQAEKLVDRRGGYNRGQSSIPKEYKEYFDSLYLQQTKPTIESCFQEVKYKANREGVVIPGIKAFRNHVRNIDAGLLTRCRDGEKAFTDKCLPYIERDYGKLSPNDIWVSDHHLWDIFVRIRDKREKDGWRLIRPWGSYWMDMRTRKIMASIIREDSPNSDIVLCSFGLGVKHHGIPRRVLLDNGKDYKARDMFYPEGHCIVSEEDGEKISESLAANLQVEVTYAIPYNAKAKPIERVFNSFEEQLGKKYASYAGSNAKKRPEDLKDMGLMDHPTLEEFIEQHNQFVYEIYNNTKHTGDGMDGRSPNQAFAELPFIVRRTTEATLFFSLMRVKGSRKVGRNGIKFNNVHYYHDECIRYLDKKVTARYSPANPEILYVFDLDENYLFTAEKVKKRGFNLTDEDYEEENRRKKIARQLALNSYEADRTIRTTESIGERLQAMADSIEKAPAADPKVFELVRNETAEENVKRIEMSYTDRNYEEYLRREREKKETATSRQRQNIEKFKKKMLDRAYNVQTGEQKGAV